jgi:predicted SprT family Zn-dependent metalloprotease
MAKKVIYCKTCGKYLGEIRDATLRKGVKYQCAKCNSEPSKGNVRDFMDRMFTG